MLSEKRFDIVHCALKNNNIIVDLHKFDLLFSPTFRLATKMNEIGSITVDDEKNCGIIFG